jgi:hypothetical protein
LIRIVLTWEECPAGKQFDETSYTRDERIELATVDEALAFLTKEQLDPTQFEPA